MRKIKVENKGFYGCYWPCGDSRLAIVCMVGDDSEDLLARSAVKWLQKSFQVNVLTMSPAKKDYGHHNLPIERFGSALEYLKSEGNVKFGIVGGSTTGMMALIAASYYQEFSLTMAFTPCDFVMEGFYQGDRDGRKEWPGENESTVTWEGVPLPYLPFAYRHPDYWDKVMEAAKRDKDLISSVDLFIASEKAHPIREEEKIKVEKIQGKLLLIGAEDDVLWETAKYIKRIEERLREREHSCVLETHIYQYGTHFVYPEALLKTMFPIGGDLITRAFASGRKHSKECKRTRMDIEAQVKRNVEEWKAGRSNKAK